jgi:hypothetical protein
VPNSLNHPATALAFRSLMSRATRLPSGEMAGLAITAGASNRPSSLPERSIQTALGVAEMDVDMVGKWN